MSKIQPRERTIREIVENPYVCECGCGEYVQADDEEWNKPATDNLVPYVLHKDIHIIKKEHVYPQNIIIAESENLYMIRDGD